MGQLTGSIAHELNQPLTGILSNAQAAEMMLKRGECDYDELTEIMAEIVADKKRRRDRFRQSTETGFRFNRSWSTSS
jgi:C4-dicarboxylate-specific signal transduction histidine kinase